MTARAVHSGYRDSQDTGRRAGQVRRLHIIREDGALPGRQTHCGQGAYRVRHSEPVILHPIPEQPPQGLSWCPKCIGHLADRLGRLDQIAAQLARQAAAEGDPK